ELVEAQELVADLQPTDRSPDEVGTEYGGFRAQTVDAAVRATPVRVDARVEPDVGTLVARDQRAGGIAVVARLERGLAPTALVGRLVDRLGLRARGGAARSGWRGSRRGRARGGGRGPSEPRRAPEAVGGRRRQSRSRGENRAKTSEAPIRARVAKPGRGRV